MERAGNSVNGALHHADLADLLLGDGPFLTIWSGGSFDPQRAAHEQADGAIPLDVAQQLGAEISSRLASGSGAGTMGGGPAGTSSSAGSNGTGGVVGIADPSGVLLVEALPDSPRAELCRVAALPSVSPLIEHRQGTVAYILALVDRRGADLFWSDRQSSGERTVDAPDDMQIQKFKDSDSGSGYRQHDMQQKVENNWDRVAADVASVLTELAGRVGSRVITVAGDVRAVQLLRQHLPVDVATLIRDVPGTRHEDGAEELRDKAVRRWLRTAVAQETVEALNVFERERGQRDRASDGAADTLTALCQARVDVLLVHDDPADERTAWFAREAPAIVALDPTTVTDLGHDPVQGRLIDVAIRAALATSAAIRIVPASGPLNERIGAILRW